MNNFKFFKYFVVFIVILSSLTALVCSCFILSNNDEAFAKSPKIQFSKNSFSDLPLTNKDKKEIAAYEQKKQEEIERQEELARIEAEEAARKQRDITDQYVAGYDISYLSNEPLNSNNGTVQFSGHQETYYSQSILPGNGLWVPGRHVADDGTIRDENGYICVALNNDWMKSHNITRGEYYIETSLGTGCVYDTGCEMGIVDIYVAW